MKKHIGLKAIAEKTGFSIKTVSRAINNHPDVNIKTKEEILYVAKKLSYYPNMVARSLRTQKAFTIGYIVPDITSEFFGKLGIVIEREFRKQGYSLLISFTEESRENEINSLKIFLAKRVDGIVLATVGSTGEFLKKVIYQYNVPVVVIDNRELGVKTNLVAHDNIYGAYVLTKHLLEHGHRRIACITGPLEETSGKERLLGFQKAIKEYNVSMDDNRVKISNWRVEGGYNSTLELMKDAGQKPSAFFIGNSIMAIGVYKALRRMELKIPDDVALVSFDNLEYTDAIEPPLTTLDKVEEEIGKVASELLLEKINNKRKNFISEHLVKAKLCIRKSCGCQ
jgi:DNA-binding LacI/PurR family transcriptional regulator